MNAMLRLLLIIMGLTMLAPAPAADEDTRIKIIATSDVHGNYFPYDFIARRDAAGGLSRVAAYVRSERERMGSGRVLLFDNGDILQGQPTAYFYNFIDTTATHLCAEALGYIGYDAATMGNHDIETGHAVYDRWVKACRFPVLGANVTDTRTGRPYLPPYVILERGGMRVAVLGMTTPAIPQWLPEELWSGLRFDDMAETARKWLPVLRGRERADIVIGLFHSGMGPADGSGRMAEHASLQVAREVPGLDLVICGHDHREACRTVVNVVGDSVPVVNPGADGLRVAEAEITLRRTADSRRRVAVKARTVAIDTLQPDAAFCERFAAQREAVERFTDEVIGHNETALSTRPAYFGPSPFVDFIHSLQLKISGADISFAAPLSFDAEIKVGAIRTADMFTLYKYENLLYVMQLSGQEIKDYLEYSYAGWTRQMGAADEPMLLFRPGAEQLPDAWQRLQTPSYNFDSAAGLRYTVDLRRPAGDKVRITGLADGREFDPAATYRVAVNSYRGNGGGDLLVKGAGIAREKLRDRIVWSTDKDLRYYLMQEIRRQGTIAPRALGQWRFVPEDWAAVAARRDAEVLFRQR